MSSPWYIANIVTAAQVIINNTVPVVVLECIPNVDAAANGGSIGNEAAAIAEPSGSRTNNDVAAKWNLHEEARARSEDIWTELRETPTTSIQFAPTFFIIPRHRWTTRLWLNAVNYSAEIVLVVICNYNHARADIVQNAMSH